MPSSASLDSLLRPGSVAIVGASPRSRMGVAVIRNARRIGQRGAIFPVNPNYPEIEGLPCYPSLKALPERPDCVVILVPAHAVAAVLTEAGEIGIRAAVVVASGFGDSRTPEGEARQRELVELAHRFDMAIAGPNCLGLSGVAHPFASTYTDLPEGVRAGGISIISQSGGLLNAAATYVHDRGGGLNYLISGGNHAVVDIPDYITFLADDPGTSVIACIMEGVKDGRRFRAALEAASPRKPIVILKLGRSEAGQRSTLAHTGTLAGRREAYATLFQQNGVAEASSIDDLMETAMLLAATKPPAGPHCVMLTISGGTTGLIADLGEAAGISFPPLSEATNRTFSKIFGVDRAFNNPVDTTGWPQLSNEGNLDAILDALDSDPTVNLVGIVFRLTPTERDRQLLGTLARRAASSEKPLVFISTVSYTAQPFREFAPELAAYPILEDLENGQRAVSRLVAYGAYRARVDAAPVIPPEARAPVEIPQARTSLTEFESKAFLGAFNLPVTRERLVSSGPEATAIAAEIGFPVAMKIQSPDIPHKSDAGGVALNLRSPEEVGAAFDRMMVDVRRACPDAAIDGVLIQEMVPPGIEMILGMNFDDQLGPLVVCGLGGVLVELLQDVSLRFAPVSIDEARAMLAELKGGRLLDGYRGSPPADREALADLIVRFSEMVAATDGAFSGIDLNPVIVGVEGQGVRIADAIMFPRPAPAL